MKGRVLCCNKEDFAIVLSLGLLIKRLISGRFIAIGREELIHDDRFTNNENRLKHSQELDEIIGEWIRERELNEVVEPFNSCGAVKGPMYNMQQIFEDPHFKYRQSLVNLEDEDLGEIHVPNVFAKFSKTPGEVKSSGHKKVSIIMKSIKECLISLIQN
jgi:crotonobetainyl-CoA:carnitine CoA-transferase CaiB-like acyl-CoA transferase